MRSPLKVAENNDPDKVSTSQTKTFLESTCCTFAHRDFVRVFCSSATIFGRAQAACCQEEGFVNDLRTRASTCCDFSTTAHASRPGAGHRNSHGQLAIKILALARCSLRVWSSSDVKTHSSVCGLCGIGLLRGSSAASLKLFSDDSFHEHVEVSLTLEEGCLKFLNRA